MKNLKPGALIVALLFLSACDRIGLELPTMPFMGASDPSSARAFLGQVKVQGPEGFCIAKAASQLSSGFAVMVPCSLLGDDETYPPHLAFITVQLGERGSAGVTGAEDALRDDLDNSASNAILRDPPAIDILETDIDDGAVAVHYRLAREDHEEGLSTDVWRVFADLGNRLVTISVNGYKDAPLTVDDGRTLLYLVLKKMRDANA